MAGGAVQIQLVNGREFSAALRDIPKIMAPLVRQELRRAGKRAEKTSKKMSLSGRPGIKLPATGRKISKTKAQKGQITSLAWGGFTGRAKFILVLKGSRFLKWHQLKGKTLSFVNPLKKELPKLSQNLEKTIDRAWKIAADRNLSQRFSGF